MRHLKAFQFFAFISLLSILSVSADPQYLIKLGTTAPVGSRQAQAMDEQAKLVSESTEGKVKVVWYKGAVLGDDLEQLRKTYLGQIDGGGWMGAASSRIVKEVALLESPFFFHLTLDDFSEVDCTLEKVYPIYRKLFEKKGFVLVDWYQHGPAYFMMKRKIEKIEDFEQFRVWVWPGYPLIEEAIKAAGVKNRVGLPVPEVLTGLQTGIVETSVAAPFALLGLQWYTEANYIIDIPWVFVTGALLIKKSSFEKMPLSLRKTFMETFHSKKKEFLEIMRQADREAYQGFLEHGIQPFSDPEILGTLKKRTQKVYDVFMGKMWSKEFYDRIVSIRDRCRASLQKRDAD